LPSRAKSIVNLGLENITASLDCQGKALDTANKFFVPGEILRAAIIRESFSYLAANKTVLYRATRGASLPRREIGTLPASLAKAEKMAIANGENIEVYTDGHCNLCRWMRAHVEPLDRDRRIEWLDFNDPEILKRAAPRTVEEMAAEMHVHHADGTWSRGYWGWIDLIAVLPRWKWMARLR